MTDFAKTAAEEIAEKYLQEKCPVNTTPNCWPCVCGWQRDDCEVVKNIAAIIERCEKDEMAQRNTEWLGDIQRHPEFGGRNLERTTEDVFGLLRRHGNPLLMAQIRQMNVQNWPEMFYFLARIAQSAGIKEAAPCK